ncbi:MAG: hypothetical protein M1836_001580 [Candelina mexicana]|nr:MAG: hypothetical protein M1836_001580 [Candelina mexicana]
MAGGNMKYRHLGRHSAHRQALLRNLVTSLFEHESISTTWHKAKEAQRMAEKLITMGKKNTEASRRRAHQIFFVRLPITYQPTYTDLWNLLLQKPLELVPKLFGPIRERYVNRPGGYTRVLRIEPIKEDQAVSAILELVDGPKDMRFAMTARTLANQRANDWEVNEVTARNIQKVTRYRENGVQALEKLAGTFEKLRAEESEEKDDELAVRKRKVYPKIK